MAGEASACVTRHPRITWLLRVLLAVIACGASGCGTRWRPATMKVAEKVAESRPVAERIDFEPYLRAFRLGQLAYERREIQGSRQSATSQKYSRFSSLNRTIEGNLIGRNFLPLTAYLHTGLRGKASLAEQRRTMPPLKGGTAFLFELAEPLEPMPRELQPGKLIASTTPLRYFDYDGRPLTPGTLTRTVELEGIEDIDCPAGRFPRCARVRIELEVRMPWLLHMSMTNYLWISAQTGEVRRVQHMSGWFLIFPFSSTYQYDLISPRGVLRMPRVMNLTPKWKYGAVLLDRVVPRPRLAGMVVDYAENVTRIPMSAPATRSSR
jgi:hypothetical protein